MAFLWKLSKPNNLFLAEKRIGYLPKNFQLEPELFVKYGDRIHIQNGYARRLPNNHEPSASGRLPITVPTSVIMHYQDVTCACGHSLAILVYLWSTVHSVLMKCRGGKVWRQIMAPTCRVTPNYPPFTWTGVEWPLLVESCRSTPKRFIFVY